MDEDAVINLLAHPKIKHILLEDKVLLDAIFTQRFSERLTAFFEDIHKMFPNNIFLLYKVEEHFPKELRQFKREKEAKNDKPKRPRT